MILPSIYVIAVQKAIFHHDVKALRETLRTLLRHMVSYFDTANESFYYGMILGMFSLFANMYHLESNRESGYGRFDLMMKPRQNGLPAVVIEIKAVKSLNILKQEAEAALKQIHYQNYTAQLEIENINDILMFGIAFYQKHVEVCMREKQSGN